MNLEEIQNRLKDRRISMIADATGLSVVTISNVRDGIGNPTIGTLQKIWDYLEGKYDNQGD